MKQQEDEERALYQRMFQPPRVQGQQRPDFVPSYRSPSVSFNDDTYSQIMDQLKAFKMDDTQPEWPLPSGFDRETVEVVRHLSSQLGLSVEKGRMENQYKVIKKS